MYGRRTVKMEAGVLETNKEGTDTKDTTNNYMAHPASASISCALSSLSHCWLAPLPLLANAHLTAVVVCTCEIDTVPSSSSAENIDSPDASDAKLLDDELADKWAFCSSTGDKLAPIAGESKLIRSAGACAIVLGTENVDRWPDGGGGDTTRMGANVAAVGAVGVSSQVEALSARQPVEAER